MTQARWMPVLAVALALSSPVAAEEPPSTEPNPSFEEGFDLLSEGARLLLQGLGEELAPLMDALSEAMDDAALYEAPERLPNGDIIIRRKTPLPEGEGEETGEEGPVEL